MEDEQLSLELAGPDSSLSPTGLIPQQVNEGEKAAPRLKVVPLVNGKQFLKTQLVSTQG